MTSKLETVAVISAFLKKQNCFSCDWHTLFKFKLKWLSWDINSWILYYVFFSTVVCLIHKNTLKILVICKCFHYFKHLEPSLAIICAELPKLLHSILKFYIITNKHSLGRLDFSVRALRLFLSENKEKVNVKKAYSIIKMWLIWKINFCIQVYRISEIYLCTLWKIMPSNFSKFRWQLVWVHVVLSIYMCMYTVSILLIHISLPWSISNVGICFSSTDLIPWKNKISCAFSILHVLHSNSKDRCVKQFCF